MNPVDDNYMHSKTYIIWEEMYKKDFLMEHFEIIDHLVNSLFNYFIFLLIGGGSHCKSSMAFHYWSACSSLGIMNCLLIAVHNEAA